MSFEHDPEDSTYRIESAFLADDLQQAFRDHAFEFGLANTQSEHVLTLHSRNAGEQRMRNLNLWTTTTAQPNEPMLNEFAVHVFDERSIIGIFNVSSAGVKQLEAPPSANFAPASLREIRFIRFLLRHTVWDSETSQKIAAEITESLSEEA